MVVVRAAFRWVGELPARVAQAVPPRDALSTTPRARRVPQPFGWLAPISRAPGSSNCRTPGATQPASHKPKGEAGPDAVTARREVDLDPGALQYKGP